MSYKGEIGNVDAGKLVEQRARGVLGMLGAEEQEIINAFITGKINEKVTKLEKRTSFFDFLGGGLAAGATLFGLIFGFSFVIRACQTDDVRSEIRGQELKSVVSENTRLGEENRRLGDLKAMMIKNCSAFMTEVTKDNEEAIQKTQEEIEQVKKDAELSQSPTQTE
jgi:hypothetical protein